MAIAQDCLGSARPTTGMVPTIAVPNDDPRLEMFRDRSEFSPLEVSGMSDCTMLTEYEIFNKAAQGT